MHPRTLERNKTTQICSLYRLECGTLCLRNVKGFAKTRVKVATVRWLNQYDVSAEDDA
jgi:hypothetical protein